MQSVDALLDAGVLDMTCGQSLLQYQQFGEEAPVGMESGIA